MPLTGQERLGKRGSMNTSVGVWLKKKAEHDKVARGMWRVHGKIYDLTDFASEHPGGAHWLTRTKGLDITDWYETHHIDTSKSNALLNKYFVEDQSEHPPLAYVYSKDNLYGKIKSKVLELSKREKLSEPTLQIQMFVVGFLMVSLLSLGYLLVENSWAAVFLYGFCHYVLTGIGHNYSHRNSWLGSAMDVSLYSKQQWVISHCLSHHNYTNLEMDLEIISFEPFLYFLTSQPENSFLAIPIILLIAFISVLIYPPQQFIDVIRGLDQFKIQQLILPLQFLLAYWMHGMSGLCMMWVAHSLNFFGIMLFTFPTHRSSQIWTEGDENPTRDFAIHVMKTTFDHNQDISLVGSMLIFQGFTDHIAHHLFPTVDRSKLHLVTPIVTETCREEGLSHLCASRSFWSIFQGVYPFLLRKKPTHRG